MEHASVKLSVLLGQLSRKCLHSCRSPTSPFYFKRKTLLNNSFGEVLWTLFPTMPCLPNHSKAVSFKQTLCRWRATQTIACQSCGVMKMNGGVARASQLRQVFVLKSTWHRLSYWDSRRRRCANPLVPSMTLKLTKGRLRSINLGIFFCRAKYGRTQYLNKTQFV